MFRNREVTHPELGKQKLDKFAELVSAYGVVERPPLMEGKMMIMILNPKPASATKPSPGKQKNAKAEDQQNGGQEVQDNGNGENYPPSEPQQPPVSAQEGE